jgi:hypothetical protein
MRRVIEIPHLPAIRGVTFTAVLPQTALVNIVVRVATHAILGCLIEALSRMTLATAHDHVQPGQRIVRLVVIEADLLPLRSCMALLALLAQRAAVGLISPVAVDAFRAELLIFGDACMTGVAVQLRVSAFESKLEADEMVELSYAPHIVAVAVGARRSEASRMPVVRLVAARAITGYRILQIAAAVTIATANLAMAPEQRETRFPGVIELLRRPIRGGVAVSALRSLASPVNIVR